MDDAHEDVLVVGLQVPDEAYEKYRGKWVAIRGLKVVAAADTLEQLWADENWSDEAAFYHVPEHPITFY